MRLYNFATVRIHRESDRINKGLEGAIAAETVTYDFERLMQGAKKVKCSEVASEMIN